MTEAKALAILKNNGSKISSLEKINGWNGYDVFKGHFDGSWSVTVIHLSDGINVWPASNDELMQMILDAGNGGYKP